MMRIKDVVESMAREELPLALDVCADKCRALHRVVRAMHDGHCPKCGWLGAAQTFDRMDFHQCPKCKFTITREEAEAALAMFRPYLQRSVLVFEEWAQSRQD